MDRLLCQWKATEKCGSRIGMDQISRGEGIEEEDMDARVERMLQS
jgi:hypothetical protein